MPKRQLVFLAVVCGEYCHVAQTIDRLPAFVVPVLTYNSCGLSCLTLTTLFIIQILPCVLQTLATSEGA